MCYLLPNYPHSYKGIMMNNRNLTMYAVVKGVRDEAAKLVIEGISVTNPADDHYLTDRSRLLAIESGEYDFTEEAEENLRFLADFDPVARTIITLFDIRMQELAKFNKNHTTSEDSE